MNKFFYAISFLLLPYTLHAQEICPKQTTPLAMTFPAEVIVLSELATTQDPESIPTKLLIAFFEALQSETPKIIFTGRNETYKKIKINLEKQNINPEWVSKKLDFVEAIPAQFQQDVFETYISPDGKLTIRQSEGYLPINKGPDLENLIKKIKSLNLPLPIKTGPHFRTFNGWLAGVGGNIEAFSNGIGIMGTGEFKKKAAKSFQKEVFELPQSSIIFDTSWLALGHIDEVLVEIARKQNPCEISILINSPKLGIEISKEKKLKSHNLKLQKKFDIYKNQIAESFKKAECKASFIDIPILYQPSQDPKSIYGTLYPSLTNGLLIEKTYFVVDPEDLKVKKHLENVLKNFSITVKWVPLKKELYTDGVVDGYIHCLTNTIRSCNPER